MLIQRWRADSWTLFKVFLRVEGRLYLFSISCLTRLLCLCVGTADWVSWWIMSFPCWVKNKVQLSVFQSSVHSVSGVSPSLRSVRRTCFYRPSQKGHQSHGHSHLSHQSHLAGTLAHLTSLLKDKCDKWRPIPPRKYELHKAPKLNQFERKHQNTP